MSHLVQTGVVRGIAKRTPGWTLHEGSGPRSWSFSVVFEEPFNQAPKIFLAVRLIDALNRHGADFRFAVEPRFITDSSFTVTASTWSDSRIWSLEVTWIAVDTRFSNQHGSMIQVGQEKFHKSDPGFTLAEGNGERAISRRMAFPMRFGGIPQVFTGLSMLDATNGKHYDLRVDSTAEDVDDYGFAAKAATFVEAKIWSLQIAWIAIDPRLLRGIPQEEVSIYGSRVKVNTHTPGYTLHEGRDARKIDRPVALEPPFSSPPQVASFLSSFNILLSPAMDLDEEPDEGEDVEPLGGSYTGLDARIAVSDEHRSQYGFSLRFGTWRDSRVWDATATWIAIGTQAGEVDEENEEEGEDEEHFDDEEELDGEEDDFLPPRANEVPRRQLSIPIIIPEDEGEANTNGGDNNEEEEAAIGPPAAKKAKKEETHENESVGPGSSATAAKLEKKPSNIDPEKECKVCMDAVINTVLVPCGHVAICLDCATSLRASGNKNCPICKKKVESIVKTYKV